MNKIIQTIFCLPLLALVSCNRDFEPIDYGKDACADCKMTIVDNKFAAELIDKKGKVFKFDDMLCLKNYIANHPGNETGSVYIEEYLGNLDKPLNALTAVYLQHDFFRSPMNGNYAAFQSAEEAKHLKDSLGVNALSWDNIK